MLVSPKGSNQQHQSTAQSRAGWSQGAHGVISGGKLTFPDPMVTIMEDLKRTHGGVYQCKLYMATLLSELLCQ